MPFQLSPMEEQVRKMVREYAERRIVPRRKQLMINDRPIWDEQAIEQSKTGFHLHIIPREKGGTGIGFVASCICVEELCAAWPDLQFVTYGEMAYYFAKAVGGPLEKKLMPRIIAGESRATAVATEPTGGSDIMGIQTNARKVDGGWVLNGRKCFISEGEYCDFIMTLAKTGDKQITAFIVEANMPGYKIGRFENTMGRKNDICEIIFDNVFLPDDHLVGQVGRGFGPFFSAVADVGRLTVTSMLNGIILGSYRCAVQYAKERKLFGRPIADLQAIQHRIADMAIDLQATRALTYRAASLRTRGVKCDAEINIAKYYATQAAIRCSLHCVNIHGAYGILEDYMPQYYYRHAPLRITAGGTDEIMKNMIAASAIQRDGNPDMSSKGMEDAGW
jgi:acyl-CoA dehydrogenase